MTMATSAIRPRSVPEMVAITLDWGGDDDKGMIGMGPGLLVVSLRMEDDPLCGSFPSPLVGNIDVAGGREGVDVMVEVELEVELELREVAEVEVEVELGGVVKIVEVGSGVAINVTIDMLLFVVRIIEGFMEEDTGVVFTIPVIGTEAGYMITVVVLMDGGGEIVVFWEVEVEVFGTVVLDFTVVDGTVVVFRIGGKVIVGRPALTETDIPVPMVGDTPSVICVEVDVGNVIVALEGDDDKVGDADKGDDPLRVGSTTGSVFVEVGLDSVVDVLEIGEGEGSVVDEGRVE
jgi:hypothetical protein